MSAWYSKSLSQVCKQPWFGRELFVFVLAVVWNDQPQAAVLYQVFMFVIDATLSRKATRALDRRYLSRHGWENVSLGRDSDMGYKSHTEYT